MIHIDKSPLRIREGIAEITLGAIGALTMSTFLTSLVFKPLAPLMQGIYSSLLGVFITVLFIEYFATRWNKGFEEKYLQKISPTFRRLFQYIYTDIEKLVQVKENVSIRNYKDILKCSDDITLNKEYLDFYKKKILVSNLFGGYRDKLMNFALLNSRYLAPRMSYHTTCIVERLDSLILTFKSDEEDLILKNVKSIFKNLKSLDDKVMELNLDD